MAIIDDEALGALAGELPPSRFRHVLGVVQSSVVLATRSGVDPAKAARAALLHDCAKAMSREQLLAAVDAYGISLDDEDKMFPSILHGPVGARVASDRFDEHDSEILDAIANHSVGKPTPSPLLQILMAADYTEPTRDYQGVEELRDAVRRDVRTGLVQCLTHKLRHLQETDRTTHSRMSQTLTSLTEVTR